MEEQLQIEASVFEHKRRVISFVSLGLLLCSMNLGFFFFAMPIISTHLKLNWSLVSWSLVFYFVVIATSLNFFRQAATHHGGIRILRLGFILFGLGSLLCAFSEGWIDLLIFRCVQALGAACLQATIFGLFIEYVPLKGYPVAVHRASFMLYFGLLLGFLLGGVSAQWFSWRFGFVFLAICCVFFLISTLKIQESVKGNQPRYDFFGAVLFLIIVSSFLSGLVLSSHEAIHLNVSHLLFLIAVMGLIIFFVYESNRKPPFMELSFYRSFGFSLVMCAKLTHSLVTTIFLITPAMYLFYLKSHRIFVSMLIAMIPALGITLSSIIESGIKKKGAVFYGMAVVFFVVPVMCFCWMKPLGLDVFAVCVLFMFGLGSGALQQMLMRTTFEILQEPAPLVGTIFRTMHNLGCALAAAITIYFMGKYGLVEMDSLSTGFSYTLNLSLVLIGIVLVFAALRALFCWLEASKNN
jgi:MFS family permease